MGRPGNAPEWRGIWVMSAELIAKLREARRTGNDPSALVEGWLHAKYRASGWVFVWLLIATVFVSVLLGILIAVLAMRSNFPSMPILSDLARTDPSNLHWMIGVLMGAAIPLVGLLLQAHNGQHRNFAALLVIAGGGSTQDALRILFDGKGGKGGVVVELLSSAVGIVT